MILISTSKIQFYFLLSKPSIWFQFKFELQLPLPIIIWWNMIDNSKIYGKQGKDQLAL